MLLMPFRSRGAIPEPHVRDGPTDQPGVLARSGRRFAWRKGVKPGGWSLRSDSIGAEILVQPGCCGQRMLEEEAQHFPRCVRSARIGKRARRTAARPGVSSSVDGPVLGDSAPAGVDMDRAGIGTPSRYLTPMRPLFCAR